MKNPSFLYAESDSKLIRSKITNEHITFNYVVLHLICGNGSRFRSKATLSTQQKESTLLASGEQRDRKLLEESKP